VRGEGHLREGVALAQIPVSSGQDAEDLGEQRMMSPLSPAT